MEKAICCYSNEDSVIKSSSSGGIAYAISYDTIKRGGVVYGVAYTNDCRSASHVRVDNAIDLMKLSGSKYVKPIDSLNGGGYYQI